LKQQKQDEGKSMPEPEQFPLKELSDIDLQLVERLRDPDFRREWFRAELEDAVPAAFKALRERRGLNQTEFAKMIGTQQPAISRFEKSTEAVWEFAFLLRMAEAMDARLRVIVEAAEDVVSEYEDLAERETDAPSALEDVAQRPSRQNTNSASALGSINEAVKRGTEPHNLAGSGQSDKGRSVLSGRSERSGPPLQLSTLSRQGLGSGQR